MLIHVQCMYHVHTPTYDPLVESQMLAMFLEIKYIQVCNYVVAVYPPTPALQC